MEEIEYFIILRVQTFIGTIKRLFFILIYLYTIFKRNFEIITDVYKNPNEKLLYIKA